MNLLTYEPFRGVSCSQRGVCTTPCQSVKQGDFIGCRAMKVVSPAQDGYWTIPSEPEKVLKQNS